MCYEVTCSTCGKKSWGGCGRHVPSVHKRIPQGQHCQCKSWPGVNLADPQTHSNPNDASDSQPASTCTVL